MCGGVDLPIKFHSVHFVGARAGTRAVHHVGEGIATGLEDDGFVACCFDGGDEDGTQEAPRPEADAGGGGEGGGAGGEGVHGSLWRMESCVVVWLCGECVWVDMMDAVSAVTIFDVVVVDVEEREMKEGLAAGPGGGFCARLACVCLCYVC